MQYKRNTVDDNFNSWSSPHTFSDPHLSIVYVNVYVNSSGTHRIKSHLSESHVDQ